jgi:hypothetical protein
VHLFWASTATAELPHLIINEIRSSAADLKELPVEADQLHQTNSAVFQYFWENQSSQAR